jgi:glycosyltransferase involved in cell wall biosynthesis
LKIALISHFYWLESVHHYDEEGGATRQLAEAVAKLGHEVIVLTQSSEVRRLKKIELGKLETWVFPRERHRNILTGLRDRWHARRYAHPKIHSDVLALKEFLAKRGPFDVLWAHAESPDGLAVAVAAQKGVKVPPMLLQVQSLRCRYEKGVPVFIDKRPLNLAFRQASRILAISEMLAENIPQYAPAGAAAEELKAKVRVVPPNIQRAFIRAGYDRVNGPAPMKDRILYLGALNPHKGVMTFLRALPKTEAAKRSSVFALIGDYTAYDRRFVERWEALKEATRVQLTGARIEYLGRVSTSEVIRQMKLARAVVIPSLFDGFGRGVIESLLIGRPVITTDHVGSSPIVREQEVGIVIHPNDPEALAHAIDAVLSPVVPFSEKAHRIGPQLAHDVSPETVAGLIDYHLNRVVQLQNGPKYGITE